MRRFTILASWVAVLAVAPAAAGPISKFDDNAPNFEGQSTAGIWDIERCLIDMPDKFDSPDVYSQPDRPDQVTITWSQQGTVHRRIDLKRVGAGTYVKGWHPRQEAANCAGLQQGQK